MSWYPHVTVACVIEDQGRFLLVEENTVDGAAVFNQPAGHLERNESLIQAAHREVMEETGWEVELLGVVGMALYTAPSNGVTYHRTTFFGRPLKHHPDHQLDAGIIGPHWLSLAEIRSASAKMRSPLVLKTIEHYLAGHRYPLEIIYGD